MRVTIPLLALPALVFFTACEAEDASGPTAAQAATDAAGPPEDDARVEAPDDGLAADATPGGGGPGQWLALIDTTEGVGVGATFGADIDAVGFDCGGRTGFAVEANGEGRAGTAANAPTGPALGAPDGPCEPSTTCAVSIGGGGSLLVRLDVADLAGCTVSVHELAGGSRDHFEVWTCPGPAVNNTCSGPWFSGSDGEVARGEVGR